MNFLLRTMVMGLAFGSGYFLHAQNYLQALVNGVIALIIAYTIYGEDDDYQN